MLPIQIYFQPNLISLQPNHTHTHTPNTHRFITFGNDDMSRRN